MYPKELFKGYRQLESWQVRKYSISNNKNVVLYSCPLFHTFLIREDFETSVLVLVETYRYNGQEVTKKHAWKLNHRVAIRIITDSIEWYHRRNLYLK